MSCWAGAGGPGWGPRVRLRSGRARIGTEGEAEERAGQGFALLGEAEERVIE